MIETTFNAVNVFLLNDAPNWDAGFQSDFAALTDIQTGLTKAEARRPYSMFLRSGLKFSITVFDDNLISFQGAMRQVKDNPAIVPFWPAIEYWASRTDQVIGGGLYVVWRPDWSVYAIYESGSEPSWPLETDLVAPALMGFFKQNLPSMLNANTAAWAFEFVESSEAKYALAIDPDYSADRQDGPQPTGYSVAPIIFPLVPDWSSVSEELRINVKRDQIGMDREYESTFYPHDAYRVNESSYTLHDSHVGELLAWFNDIASQGGNFWTVGSMAVAVLASGCLATDTVLHLVNSAALLAGDYIAMPNGASVVFAKVQSIAGADVTLTGQIGAVLPAASQFYALALSRQDKPQLSLTWASPTLAKAKIQWLEVRLEEDPPGSETVSATFSQLRTRAVLFDFSRDYANGTIQHWYFNSGEVDLDILGHLWISKPFQVGDITQSLNLENDSANIDSFIFTGNPLVAEIAMQSEAPLSVAIQFVEFDGSEWVNPVPVFSGDCTTISREGSILHAKCNFGPSLFDTDLPRFVRGPMCNHIGGSNSDGSFLISAGCTLLKSDWKFTARAASPISSAFPFTLTLDTLAGVGASAISALAAPRIFLNWFTNGWIEFGTGASMQRRLIIGSTVPSGGGLALTLHRYLSVALSIGDAFTLFPGCDGLYATCKAYNATTNPKGKFNNKINFGGEPFTPVANPSSSGLPNLNTQGGKK